MRNLLFIFLFELIFILNLTGQTLDTLFSYDFFKFYQGKSDTLYLEHPRLFGYFVIDTCESENYATTLNTPNGCYRRIFQNYNPRFWELGRQSALPILGGTMIEEIDAINSAAYTAYVNGGDTIEIDSFYLIDRPVYLFDNNTYLGSSESCGFKRIDPPKTTLISDANMGDDKIKVSSTEGFRKFHKVNIASGKAFDQLSYFSSYTGSVSQFLGGDTTIFLSGLKIQNPMSIGDTISLVYPMMEPLLGTTNNINIENLIFDGNRNTNNLTYDWRAATTIVTPSSNNTIIQNCNFYNIPSENMFICGTKLINCTGEGFNGSAVHFSCQNGEYDTEVLYNDFTNTNEIGDSIMEHSEAALTFSAKVQNLKVRYNKLDHVNEKGVGDFAGDDFGNVITDNLFNSKKEVVGYQPFYDKDSSNTIYNNKNLLDANQSDSPCTKRIPKLVVDFQCNGNTDTDNPLLIGDTLQLVFDTILIQNTNENFIKCIEPIYDSEYFRLASMKLSVGALATNHQWKNNIGGELCDGLVFDNGHRGGIFSNGNWGYEKCEEKNGCFQLKVTFVLENLPELASEVPCPLQGIQFSFDSELETWDAPLTCLNEPIIYGDEELGRPFLKGLTSTIVETQIQEFTISPNPAETILNISNSKKTFLKYNIIDIYGRKVKKGIYEDQIDINLLESGIYILELETNNGKSVEKFIKI